MKKEFVFYISKNGYDEIEFQLEGQDNDYLPCNSACECYNLVLFDQEKIPWDVELEEEKAHWLCEDYGFKVIFKEV